MRQVTGFVFFYVFIAGVSAAFATQTVHFRVTVPPGTGETDSIFVAGSLPGVGGWKADGLKLSRQADGSFSGDVDVEAGQKLEFKITRGSWETVEKNADGSERANRVLDIGAATKQVDVTVERWANDVGGGKPAPTVVGELKLHKIESAALKQSRTIRVWLPQGYDADPTIRCDVLYMHDGQNCFDRSTSAFGNEWKIDEALTRLIAEGRIRPLIVVGIDNGATNRISEYTFSVDPKHGGGQGAVYAEFLLKEVMPFVEKTYRTQPGREHTFIGGSSLGGLVSLEIARRYPGTFGGVVAMSPAIWWAGQMLTQDVEHDAGGLTGTRIWLDIGAREAVPLPAAGSADDQNLRFVETVRRLDGALAKHHIEHHLVIDDQFVEHNEISWAHRFPDAITYVLGSTR